MQMPSELKQCNWTEYGIKFTNERFLQRNQEGKTVETIEGMCWRVAYEIASADKKYGKTPEEITALAIEFYNLMADRKFFPNAPTLYNAGTGNGLQYSACFVLPVGDSMEEIFDALKWQALIHKSGGGTGFSFSKLRPKNAMVGSTRGVSSGPISFMKIFDAATASVKQGGKRRGANMGILRVDHPDILEFIQCKGVLSEENQRSFDKIKSSVFSRTALEESKRVLLSNQISNFNISVAVTDAFMKAVKENTEYDLINPQNNQVVGRLKAQEVFNLIVNMAWETGDPGLWFIDKTNRSTANPVPNIIQIEATNPCGEQPLFPYDVCNLGSIALVRFAVKKGNKYVLDWNELERTVRLAVHFLDNVIEVNPYPLPPIMELAHQLRRIGLGVMGWGDLLAYLNIPYDSIYACEYGEKIMNFVNRIGHNESEKLAEERGPFPLWDKSIYKNEKPIRNCTITTIAPTGEIRTLAGCSGGIEPLYGLTEEHEFEDRILYIIQPAFDRLMEIAKERGFYSQQFEEHIKHNGYLSDSDNIPPEVKKIFITAHEIKPEWHIRMQAAFQKHTDNGVSKTVNLSNSAAKADIEEAYRTAYESECLGITVYRDGCKGTQVLHVGIRNKAEKKADEKKSADFVKSRPDDVQGKTIKVETPYGNMYVTINFDAKIGPKEPFEIFLSIGKAGSDVLADVEAIARGLSMILRLGSPMPTLERLKHMGKKQYDGIGGSQISGFGKEKVSSLADGIAKAIENYLDYYGLNDDNPSNQNVSVLSGNNCPQCQKSTLIREEGCTRCTNCDYTIC